MPAVQGTDQDGAGAVAYVQAAIIRSVVLIGLMWISAADIRERRDRQSNTVRPCVISVQIHSLAKT